MSDGQVQYKFLADAAAVERAFATMEKKLDSYEAKLKNVARESKKSKRDEEDALGRVAGALGDVVSRYGTVAAAVGVITSAYGEWRREIDAATEAQDKFGRKLTESLTLSGDLLRGRQIQGVLQNMPGVTQEVAASAFFGVRGGAPSLDLGRAQEVTTQVAGTQGFIFRDNPQQLEAFGELAGKLAEIAPGKSAQDITDLAAAVSGAAGRNIGSLTSQGAIKAMGKLVSGGMPVEEAAAMMVRGLDVGMRPQSLADMKGGDRALLGDAQVAALTAQFGQAQVTDLAFKNLAAAGALAPDDLVEFRAAATLQKRLRGTAEEREFAGAAFSAAESESGFVERFGLRTIGRSAERAHAFAGELFGIDQGAAPATSDVNNRATAILAEILGELKQQRQNNRPPIRREAQSE